MRLRFLIPVVTLALGGCASTAGGAARSATTETSKPPPAAAPRPADPVLILTGSEGTVSVTTANGKVAFRAPYGMSAPDASTIVQAQPLSSGTRVVASDPSTGIPRWSHDVAGQFRVRVVAPGGRFVALVDGSVVTPSAPRATTVVDVVGPAGARRLHLAGNLDPEAFSTDGRYLYTLDFLPALNPTRYSVRRVDLRTLRVETVPDRNGRVRSPMPGYARRQLMSPDGRQLYTFYASQDPVHADGESYHAWVHVLNLAEGWAHCVELDEKIGVGNDVNPALAVSPDGSRLFATDGVTHAIAEIDTRTLDVVRTRFLASLANADQPALAATDGHTVFAPNRDGRLAAIDARTLVPEPSPVQATGMSALRIDQSGEVLFLLTSDGVLVLDRRGHVVHRWPNPGDATSIDPAVTVPGRGAYECAC